MFKLRMLLMCVIFPAVVLADPVDPTRPLGANAFEGNGGVTEQKTLSVSSILIASDRKLAIINGQTVHEKELVKGIGVVQRIEADAVTLQQEGRLVRIPLNKTVVRK